MLKVKTILLPTDFSPTSDAALAPACHWSRQLGAELHVFHVVESLRPDLYPAALGVADPASTTTLETARKELETRRRLATHQGAIVTCAAVQGLAAAPTILDYAEAHDIDLVVMSTHGRRGVRRLLLGSVAEEVVQRSICPVLAVGGGPQAGHSFTPKRILVGVDLSEHSPALVAHAKELAALFNAQLQLFHVVVRPPLPASYDGVGIPNLVFDSPLLEKEAQSALETLYHRASAGCGPFSVHVEHGLAVEQIVRFAAANSADLILVASHGLTGVSHLLIGSVAERVVRQASCPVLTIKSFGKSMLDGESRAAVQVRASARNCN